MVSRSHSFVTARHSSIVDKTHKKGRNHRQVRYCELEPVDEWYSETHIRFPQRYGASLRKQVKKVSHSLFLVIHYDPCFFTDGDLSARTLHMHFLRQGKAFPGPSISQR